MKCPEEIIDYMHEFLDEEINSDKERILKEHLQDCEECRIYFEELKQAVSLVAVPDHIALSTDFTQKVMANLPAAVKREKRNVKGWLMSHPMLSAAVLFLVLISGALISSWNQEDHFSVSNHSSAMVIKRNTVIVPKGKTVKGDILVKNGDIMIEGKVQGDVTVIHGKRYLASAGSVTGDIKEINQAFDWLWYQIKNSFKTISASITNKDD
ncbi:anti-sigma factor family protein [Peribacillus kribbensis]|uniref:anti-sigma factor family protein n=1 Tax=Peribacillus kribbensis TaxID=356658 RepID=UPI000426B6C4|nr:anti-sigma factor [Peribacillus kribbensis]